MPFVLKIFYSFDESGLQPEFPLEDFPAFNFLCGPIHPLGQTTTSYAGFKDHFGTIRFALGGH